MPLSVRQLRTPSTREQVIAVLIDYLESIGFSPSSWQEGSAARNLLEAVADTYAGATEIVAQILEQTLEAPSGAWQDMLGALWYQLPRLEAVAAQRNAIFVAAASAPLQSISVGTWIVTTTGDPVRWRVTSGTEIGPSETVSVPVIAEFGGVAGNTARAVKIQSPSYSGLTLTLDAPDVPGVDREPDARYQQRLDRRFAELTYSVGLRAYELWALTAAPSLTRVRAVNDYPNVGNVTIALDPGEASEISQVELYVEPRRPPNDVVVVTDCSEIPVTIRIRARAQAGVTVATVTARLDRLLLLEMPIGGWRVVGAVAGRLLREKITEALLCREGVLSVGLELPASDVVLGPTDIVVPTYDIEVEEGS